MTEDIDPILGSWEASESVRKITGSDGAEKVQLRVEVNGHRGLLQFNCDGRPDGKRPHGREFALDHQVERLSEHVSSRLPAEDFLLPHEDALELVEEAALIYQRYVVLMRLGDYGRVMRDTARNMRLFRFLKRHARVEEDANSLERWWPYIIRIHQTARAFSAADRDDFEEALDAVREAGREIVTLVEQDDPVFKVERERSVKALSEMESFFAERLLPDKLGLLGDEKLRAIEREDYERAAQLRDEIERLKKKPDEKS